MSRHHTSIFETIESRFMSQQATFHIGFSNFQINLSNIASIYMKTRLRLLRFILRTVLVTNLLFLHYIDPSTSYFGIQDIWLQAHILSCLLNAFQKD